MIFYILLAIVPIIMTPIVNTIYKSSINRDDRAKRTFLLCCGACLFIMIAFRNRYIGSIDSVRYYEGWLSIQEIPIARIFDAFFTSELEPGYRLTIWVLARLFPHPQMVFVFSGLFTAVSLCRFIYKNSDDVMLSFVMFICLGPYSFMAQGLRQAIAMGICLFAFEYFKKKKVLKFVLVVLFATLFHKSAVVFLALILLYFIGFNTLSYIIMIIGSIVFWAMSNIIAYYANLIFDENYNEVASGGGFVAISIYILILFFAWFFAKKNKNNTNYINAFYMTYIGLVIFVLRYSEFGIADRVSFYFMFGQIILFPKVISNFDKRTRLFINFVVIVLSVLLFAYRLSTSDLIPYKFFWQQY